MAAIILFSWWVLPISRFSHSLYQEASRMQRRWRLFLLAALFLVALAALPVPTRKFASGWIQPAQTQGVFASTAAKMMECRIHDGQRVQAGQLLFRLSNQELAMRLTQRAAASEQAVARESSIRRQRDMHGFDLDLTPYEADRKTTQILYENTKREHQSLFVSARIPGYVLAQTVPNAEGPSRSDQTVPDATWCNPTEVGRVVPEGALLATICSEEMLAVIPLTDRQLSVVAAGTQVKLRVANPAGKVVQGRVAAVVQRDEVGFLANSDDHAAFHAQESIQSRTSGNSYAAIVEMPTWDSPQQRPFPGATVDAVFAAPSQTVFSLATDWLTTNLRFLAD